MYQKWYIPLVPVCAVDGKIAANEKRGSQRNSEFWGETLGRVKIQWGYSGICEILDFGQGGY